MEKLTANELQALPALSQLFLHDGALFGRFGLTNLLIVSSLQINPSFSDMMESAGNVDAWSIDALENGGDVMIGWMDNNGLERISRYTQNRNGDYMEWSW